jgi:hypothetical protein
MTRERQVRYLPSGSGVPDPQHLRLTELAATKWLICTHHALYLQDMAGAALVYVVAEVTAPDSLEPVCVPTSGDQTRLPEV